MCDLTAAGCETNGRFFTFRVFPRLHRLVGSNGNRPTRDHVPRRAYLPAPVRLTGLAFATARVRRNAKPSIAQAISIPMLKRKKLPARAEYIFASITAPRSCALLLNPGAMQEFNVTRKIGRLWFGGHIG